MKTLKRRGDAAPSPSPGVLISAQVKAGLDELTEGMPRKAITAQESGHASGLPVVMAAVFITSFPSTGAKQQIRLASDGGELAARGRARWHGRGGEMPTRCTGTAEEGPWTNVKEKMLILATRG